MAYTELATGTWGTGPKIPYTFYYSKRRSGKDMIYKIKVVIGAVTGYSSFGYPIKVSVNCGGQTASSQIKNASPSQWSSPITYETSDLTVANKTTGTTALSITLTGVDAPRGSTSYTYNLPIDAAMSNVSATNANIGSVSKITISKSNSSFTHTLQYSYNGTSFTNIVTKTSAATYDWTIPTDTYNQLGIMGKSKTITIKCITYSGSTEIGSQTTKITAYAVEADCKPTVSITITNNSANTTLTGSADTIINNNGGVVITGAATAKYNATIATNTISVGSEVYANTSKTFTSLPSGTIKFTATDSRGYSNTATANRTVIQYVKPTITIEKPVITTEGVATFETKGNWFNGSFGAANNTLTVQYAYGVVDGTYSEWKTATITKSGNTFSANITVSNLDYTKRYKFKTRVVDKLNTISSNEVFGQAIPIFDWGENDFQFNVPIYSTQDIYFGSNDEKGLTTHKNLVFRTSGGTNEHYSYMYGGDPNSAVALGMWDDVNNRRIMQYSDTENTLRWGDGNTKNYFNNAVLNNFIIDSGTTDGWYWRKYKDGTVELFATKSFSGVNATKNNYSGFYYSDALTINYPFTIKTVIMGELNGGSKNQINFIKPISFLTDKFTYWVCGLSNTATSCSGSVYIHIIGTM